MDTQMDCRGMKCPQPVLKVAIKAKSMSVGDVLTVMADCPSFPSGIVKWCSDSGNVLISCVKENDDSFVAIIQF